MSFTLRNAVVSDAPIIFELIKEYSNDLNDISNFILTVNDIIKDAFSLHPKIKFFIACYNDKVLGYCAFFEGYSIFHGKAIMIEEMYIKKAYRKIGIGLSLFSKLIEFSYLNKFNILEWPVNPKNEHLINLNANFGAKIKEDLLIFKLTKEVISKYYNTIVPSDLDIRFASNVEMPAVFEIIENIAKKEVENLLLSPYDLMKDGFSKNPKFKVIIAVENYEIIGMIFFFKAYSTFNGNTLIIETVYVKENHRKQGIANSLFDYLINYAMDNNINKIETGIYQTQTSFINQLNKMGIYPDENLRIAQFNKDNFKQFID